MMYTIEKRKPLHQLEYAVYWVRDAEGRVRGMFHPKNEFGSRRNIFRPRIGESSANLQAIASELNAELGLPIFMGK